MSGEAIDVSVVVPLLNEESSVTELVTRICAVFDRRRERFELLLVDDGSLDATAARLREIEADDPRVRVFEFTRNFGQAAALACGIFEARGRVVVTIDGDLQNPPEEIPKLLDAVEKGAFVVSTTRTGSGSAGGGVAGRGNASRRFAGDDLQPIKARILLMLALATTSDPAEVQRMFRDY